MTYEEAIETLRPCGAFHIHRETGFVVDRKGKTPDGSTPTLRKRGEAVTVILNAIVFHQETR